MIVDPYGFSGIRQELNCFDRSFGLPAPPHFTILQPNGPIPPFNPTKRPMMVGWAQETTLDVEYSHAIAPKANILLVETTVPETLGVQGFPDISMSAAVNGAALVYLNANAAQGPAGFYLIGGTSEASPLFAGIIAIADQWAGHGLGLINPALYAMEAANAPGIVDVRAGNTTVTFPQSGAIHTVNGFSANNRYDMSTGVGTVDTALFVPELVAADSH